MSVLIVIWLWIKWFFGLIWRGIRWFFRTLFGFGNPAARNMLIVVILVVLLLGIVGWFYGACGSRQDVNLDSWGRADNSATAGNVIEGLINDANMQVINSEIEANKAHEEANRIGNNVNAIRNRNYTNTSVEDLINKSKKYEENR